MPEKNSVAVILPAGGLGTRLGYSIPKAFIRIAGKTILEHTLERFYPLEAVGRIIVPVPEPMLVEARLLLSRYTDKPVVVIEGGKERLYSINNALKHIGDASFVAVHDAVRPMVTEDEIVQVIKAAVVYKAAMLVCPSDYTLKRISEDMMIEHTEDRSSIWQAQTPQVFEKSLLLKAYDIAIASNFFGTDDASLVERTGAPVKAVHGSGRNIKITRKQDLELVRFMMNSTQQPFRIGYGYDTHRLKTGRKLVLGGVEIPYEKGLDGHSDADVLIHAIIDAMVGALALGDIGSHFPDTDPAYSGADSRKLFRAIYEVVKSKGYVIGNVDSTVVAERPKLRNLIDTMRANIAEDLETSPENISVKATTSEKIGFVGREEGMSASAVVLLVSNSKGQS